MIELKGKHNIAKVFTDSIEQTAMDQIIELCDQAFTKGEDIRVMPDCHAGAGCTIGTTMTITDKVVPNLVGVDIGCGILTVKLNDKHIEVEHLDKIIKANVPSGFTIRTAEHKLANNINLDNLRCKNILDSKRELKAIGTLGGGNHFIEVDKDKEGTLYLVIHSGSRHLGLEIARHYQNIAIKKLADKSINKALAYLQGQDFDDYLNDMKIAQEYAELNREVMAAVILREMKLR